MEKLIIIAVVLAALVACKAAPSTKTTPKPETSVAVTAEKAPLQPSEEVMTKTTLAEAVAFVRPHCADAKETLSPGSILLTLWAKDYLTAPALDRLPSTTYKAVQRDSEEERGKKICTTGKVVQIRRDRAELWGTKKVWEGVIMLPSLDALHFIAVGEVADITEGTTATYCGVVIGRYSYGNTRGGTALAVTTVGLFKSFEP